MNEEYKSLIEKAKNDYAKREKVLKQPGKRDILCPRWYDLGLKGSFVEELNLWNYWQGIGVDQPKLMVVGQDWGKIDVGSPLFKNIQAIAANPDGDTRYLSGYEFEDIDFQTDKELVNIFETHLGWDLINNRRKELYFTNLCLGYRQDNSTGDWRESWLSNDMGYFSSLVEIKRPEAIVCLGRATSEKAYQALTGKKLEIPSRFNDFLDGESNGMTLPICGSPKFYAMAHPGGRGTFNRKRSKGDGWSVVDDWAFLRDLF